MTAPTLDHPTATPEVAPAQPQPSNVIEAILAVMRDVKALAKNERNNATGGGYNFRGIDATVNALGPAMRKHGLVVLPTLQRFEHRAVVTTGNKPSQASDVEVEYRFYGPGGPQDMVSTVVPGEAWDSGDKGVAKAMSVAFRIALLQTFALPTDERDVDEDTHEGVTFDTAAFMARVDNALGQRTLQDVDVALVGVGNRYGRETLEQVPVTGPDGAVVSAAALITMYLEQTRTRMEEAADRAQADTAQQAAEGPARDVRAEESAGQEQDARAQQDSAQQPAASAQEEAPRTEQPAQHPNQAAEAARAETRTSGREAREQAHADLYRQEIAEQARVLGLPDGRAHIGPFLESRNVKNTTELSPAVLAGWVRGQRDRVINALRDAGRTTEAAHYTEAAAKGLVAPWGILLGHDKAMTEDGATQQQPAAS